MLVGLVVVVLALAVACSSSGPTSEPTASDPPSSTSSSTTPEGGPRAGGTLRIGVPATATSFAPAGRAWNAAELQTARGVYDRLMVRDNDDVAQPDLATAVSQSDDHTVWTITLRPGVVFHDGTPLDAAVVAANLEAQRSSPDAAALLAPIASVQVTDATTMVVLMATPWSTFDQVLTTQVGYVASLSTLAGASAVPIGSGPFSYAGVAMDGSTSLVKNPSYWKPGLPYLDQVTMVPIAEAADRVDAVLAHTVDLVAVDEPRQLSRVDDLGDTPGVAIVEDRNGERPKVAIAFETGRAPFDHINARRAVGLATDREELLDKAFGKQGTIARSMLSDASPWFSDHTPPQRDLARSREEAAKYTAETGQQISFELLVPPDPTVAHVASMWRLQLAQAGIDVQIVPSDQAAIDAATLAGQYQTAIGVGFSDAHPDLYEPLFRGIPAVQPEMNTNITRYVNPAVTKAFADARQTVDIARQADDYRIVQEQLAVDDPYLFLIQVRSVSLAATTLRDLGSWVPGSGSSELGDEATTVSLTTPWFQR